MAGNCSLPLLHGQQVVTAGGPAARRKELSAGVEHEEEAPIIGRQWFSWGAAVPGDANHPRWLWLCARNYAPSTHVRPCSPPGSDPAPSTRAEVSGVVFNLFVDQHRSTSSSKAAHVY